MTPHNDMEAHSSEHGLSDGLITPVLGHLFYALQYLPPQVLLKPRSALQRRWEEMTEESRSQVTRRRAKLVDAYVLAWIVAEVAAIPALLRSSGPCLVWLPVLLVSLRLIDIVQANLNIALFEGLRVRRHYVASQARIVVNCLLNFVELALLFASLYQPILSRLDSGASWLRALAISWGIQFSVPVTVPVTSNALQILFGLQGFLVFLFTVLLIGRFAGHLLPILTAGTEPVRVTPERNSETSAGSSNDGGSA